LTDTVAPSMVTSTPDGTVIGRRPIRDMLFYLSSVCRLPDVGEDFPTHALLGRLTVGEQTGGGGQDGDAQAAQHVREVRGLGVHAQTGLGDAAQAGDGPLALRTELQLDDELLAHLGVLF